MTIRRRLVIMTVAIFAAVLVVSGVAAQLLLADRLLNDVDAELNSIRSEMQSVATDIPVDALERILAIETPGFAQSNLAVVAIDADGSVLGAIPSGTVEAPDPLPELADADIARLRQNPDPINVGRRSDVYRVTAAPLENGVLLILARPLDGLVATLRGSTQILLGVGLTAAIILAASIWWLIRRELRPLHDMATTADRINEGDLSERVAIARPSTEVGRLGGALNAMLGRIEDALGVKRESEARMRQFVGDAAHELRTPLTSIRGYAELYRRGANTPEHIERSFGRIEHEAARMGGLVDDLVLLAKLDEERPFTRERVDMQAVAEEALADARAIEPDRPLALEIATDQVTVDGDADRLRQVVVNLLGNVRAHTHPDTAATIRMDRDGPFLVIAVVDEGPGMTPADTAQAFERFYQSGSDRATPGSGLGLSIVRSIIESLGGDVALNSKADHGTTVTVRLRLAGTSDLADPQGNSPAV